VVQEEADQFRLNIEQKNREQINDEVGRKCVLTFTSLEILTACWICVDTNPANNMEQMNIEV
jgi:hypothetical protein